MMSDPSRAPRLQYHHIVVLCEAGEGEGKAGKCGNCGERGEGVITLFDAGAEMAYVPYN